ncbi:Transposable element Tcb2 transposase [Anthophora quadrimaculata]
MVWRKVNEVLKIKNLKPTVKHGGGNVIIWGCILTTGVGELIFIDGIMDKNKYLDILKTNLIKSASNLGIRDTFKFYQDNDHKHKSRIVQEYLLYKCPKVLHPPPQSPDLNPIENLWDQLDRNIRTTPIKTITELMERLLEEWRRIPHEYLKKIICNMPKRLYEVIKQKGQPAKY